jgi:hypothetical protein
MLTRYMEPQGTRFRREFVDGIEQVRIPLRRNWLVLLFISFWICGWTAAGIGAMADVVVDPNAFMIFWLGMWAVGWLFAAGTIASQVAGSEIIRVVGRHLEIGIGVGKLRWRRRYRGDQIHNLDSSDPNPWGWQWWQAQGLRSPFGRRRQGAIKFDYGSETIYAASSVDEPEGRMIIDWLAPKLPRSATERQYSHGGGAANFQP